MCSLFFERFVLFFCLKIERFVPETTEIWICGLYINDLIIYNKNGTIGISKIVKSSQRQIELSNTIEDLALEHERLRIIRQTWYHIATSSIYSVEQVKAAISDEPLRKNIMIDSGIPLNVVNRIKHPIYWSLLCEYFWFYEYFTQ